MHRYALTLAAFLIAAPLLAQTTPEPPLNTPAGIVILGPELSPASPVPGASPIYCTAGRFIPITPADGMPSYIADSPGYRVYRVAPGSSYTGVKFDAADSAEPETYSWPTAKGPVYCLLARNVPGRYAVQLVKNGSVETGPVANGAPIMVEVGQGPRPPPPGPTPVPPGPTPVPPGPAPVPVPPGPAPDPALLSKLSTAMTKDLAAGASKQHAASLAVVYDSSAILLSLNDPAVAPKTIGDLYEKTFAASVAKGIPRRPYLSAVRGVIDEFFGTTAAETPLTDPMRLDFQAKYRALAAALTEASK